MIFLFRFDKKANGLDFVLNEAIAEDMYEDIHEELIPIVEIVGRELSPYKIHSIRNTVIEFVIHDDGQGEVKLSPGLGSFIPESRKQAIFQHSKEIADLCVEVMNRSSAEARL
ncbi:hypothetical protein NX029_11640 [Cytobacillus firmus]|nr:hypothetical protein [Cytobacillus firmus]